MNEYKIEMILSGDTDYFYNTVLMIAKGYNIEIIESKLRPLLPEKEEIITPTLPPIPREKNKGFLSIIEASEYLNLSKHTLYKYTMENTIPHYKLGSRTLFKIDALEDWIENHRKK